MKRLGAGTQGPAGGSHGHSARFGSGGTWPSCGSGTGGPLGAGETGSATGGGEAGVALSEFSLENGDNARALLCLR